MIQVWNYNLNCSIAVSNVLVLISLSYKVHSLGFLSFWKKMIGIKIIRINLPVILDGYLFLIKLFEVSIYISLCSQVPSGKMYNVSRHCTSCMCWSPV